MRRARAFGTRPEATENEPSTRADEDDSAPVRDASSQQPIGQERSSANEAERDVTERCRLEEIQARMAAIVASSDDAIITEDLDGNILTWNDGATSMFGYSADQVIGRPAGLLYPPKMREDFEAFVARIREGGSVSGFETERLRSDGETIDVSVTLSPIRNAADRVVGIASIARNITDHKRMEAALFQSRESFRLAFKEAPVGVCVLDAEGRFTRVNDRLCTILQRPESELLNTKFVDLESPDDSSRGPELFDLMMRGKSESCEYEREYVRGDGARVWAVVHAAVFDDPLGVNRVVAHMVDITPRKHALEALRRSEERYRRLNAELEQRVAQRTAALRAVVGDLEGFSYSISHDLRAPLRAIDGFSLALLEDYSDVLDDEGKRLLGIVRSSATKMGDLIDDILDFSRTSRKEVAHSDVDMEQLAAEVWEELSPSLAERDITFTIGHLPHANADRAMMHQVFANLLDNAIKFTSRKERGVIEVSGSADADHVAYSVSDNGSGFDMAYADKLFGVFQRLHGEDEFPGTGIGLAIAKRIVEKHGGSVEAEGHVDQGARFTFTLPTEAPADDEGVEEGEG